MLINWSRPAHVARKEQSLTEDTPGLELVSHNKTDIARYWAYLYRPANSNRVYRVTLWNDLVSGEPTELFHAHARTHEGALLVRLASAGNAKTQAGALNKVVATILRYEKRLEAARKTAQ